VEGSWVLAFVIALVVLACGVSAAIIVGRLPRKTTFKPLFFILIAVFVSLVVLFFPAALLRFENEPLYAVEALLYSLQAALRIFMVDTGFEPVLSAIKDLNTWVQTPYILLVSLLCIAAPVLIFSFALSFIKGFTTWLYYVTVGFNRDAYIFSALNQQSLTLAESISKHYSENVGKRPLIFFTRVLPNSTGSIISLDESIAVDTQGVSSEMLERCRLIGAVCIKKDILSFRFDRHSKKKKLCYIVINDNSAQNNDDALEIIQKYSGLEQNKNLAYHIWSRSEKNTFLSVFESSKSSELFLDGKGLSISVRRIDTVRAFVYNFLWDNGVELFQSALESNGVKQIGTLIVGLGKSGTEMLRALSWFGQMDGYSLKVDCFDSRENAQQRFELQFPGLADSSFHELSQHGEAQYSITIHPSINAECKEFHDAVSALAGSTSFVFVSTGQDDRNFEVALALRILFERAGVKPLIYAVIHDSLRKEFLNLSYTQSKEDYGIRFVGVYEDVFSYKTVFDSALEEKAHNLHMTWAKRDGEEGFEESKRDYENKWKQEYCRNSSMAQLIHNETREALGIEHSAPLEHRRWNAYLRSEGWIWSGSTDTETRNNLAKMHPDLTSFDALPPKEQNKDAE
jgi:hypothetical protein